ncbi:serine hydrolase domain-containing protein [Streptomyces spectabilis]|uniref:Class A beta-lactamase-related serine hydrolase n=1 Tax=Streptomyces spectabilis TaxID=68270 RepID=A0A5P2X0W9_STRST|nr:serine hydrolase domain-containing protein [Streptomyces spectabilis]MBB5101249.1 D-alanyl-D-alanine carboxypeptidase [Streptomyces spectabilis]MCI3900449.1 beta-lactamase family protein [Streptomyces spectabilis]QEV58028.1 class A beta-lactamase-related serine hydrolase [Streptomyces spectabilis]GGV10221.1 D-alanyl-D-alanine carboxypeptidase [Streptomyces spectabilis]
MALRKSTKAGVVGVAAAALAATAFVAPAGAASDAPSGHRATQRAMDAAVRAGIPGITAQARDGDGVWKAASGVGDLTSGAPRGKNDKFRVGSITKTFVATVLLQLESEGRLDLDDTVEHHLPGLVRGNGNDGNKITVRQLLNHTSGLFDYLADPEYSRTYMEGDGYLKHRYDTLPPKKHVRVALSHQPLFEPGAKHSYSNTNYVLAGLIVEKAGKRTYEKEVRDRIIGPLGLKHTSNPGNSIHLPRPSSRGYSKLFRSSPDRIDDITEMNGSQGWADGDIISTAGDLTRFYSALLRGKLLPPKQLKAMKTTVAVPGSSTRYGLGISRLRTGCGTTLWGHGGGMIGWLSMAVSTEDGRHQLAYNYNGDWETSHMPKIVDAEYCGTS